MRRHRSTEERYWSKVKKTSGCWSWTGTIDNNGYAIMSIYHKASGVRAHRISWELHYGPIPAGMFVLHHCDNPICSRPDHLFLGTQRDNLKDMRDKGRQVSGERHGRAKLTPSDVRSIRKKRAAGEPLGALAKEYGVSFAQIGRIARGDNWREANALPG